MTDKAHILQAIRNNLPPASPLPHLPTFSLPQEAELFAHFNQTLQGVGGRHIELQPGENLAARLSELFPEARQVASSLPHEIPPTVDAKALPDPHDLRDIDLAVLPGEFAIAENAAIWISEKAMMHRALPFITQHLVLVVKRSELVWNLHQAYERLEIERPGFGLFLSGPSKTADIEQSLVIGAHGARSLTVVWVEAGRPFLQSEN